MTQERAPKSEESLVDGKAGTTSWDDARERLANPEPGRHNWLATVRPDGRPHLMPVLTFWMDGALNFVAGEPLSDADAVRRITEQFNGV
jgi:hypothetical protein